MRLSSVLFAVAGCAVEPGFDQLGTLDTPLTSAVDRPMPIVFESPAGCLDTASADLYERLVPTTCNGATSQTWRVHPTGEIQSANDNHCLAWTTRSFGRNGSIQRTGLFAQPCQTTPEFTWTASPMGELRANASCLTATTNGIALLGCDGSSAQHWRRRLAPPSMSAADQFGFAAMRRAQNHVVQAVPLVRVYVNYTSLPSRELAHPVRYYEQLIFGPGFPSLNGYLAEASSGLFQFIDAGRFGPFDDTTQNPACDASAGLERVLDQYLTGAIDLAAYDADRNGTVTHDELQVMVIGNCGGRIAGAYRGVSCLANVDSGPNRLQFCPGGVIEIEDQVQFATLVHEAHHALGAIDLYPSLQYAVSIMGATIALFSGPDYVQTFMIDPWHRFQLGWNRPHIVDLGGVAQSHGTLSFGADHNVDSNLFIGTPDKYFIFELRRRSTYQANQFDPTMILAWVVDATPLTFDAGFVGGIPFEQPIALANGRIAAVWSDNSDSISWRLGCELDLTITENSHTSNTANVTVEARDRHDNRLVRVGKVLVDGVAAGSLNQPFDYERRLDLVCELGTCTPVFRPRTFRVTADGCTAAESSHI